MRSMQSTATNFRQTTEYKLARDISTPMRGAGVIRSGQGMCENQSRLIPVSRLVLWC